jgi:signal transduction histidine kinase
VVLAYAADRTTLSIEDRLPEPSGVRGDRPGLAGVGGGRGLAGMRERVERVGGHMDAGPTERGWRVTLDVPA